MSQGHEQQDYSSQFSADENLRTLVYLIALFSVSLATGLGIEEEAYKKDATFFLFFIIPIHIILAFSVAMMSGPWSGVEWVLACLACDLGWSKIFQKMSASLDPLSIVPVLIIIVSFLAGNRIISILPEKKIPEKFWSLIYLTELVFIFYVFQILAEWR